MMIMTAPSIETRNKHSEQEESALQALFESLELISTALFLPIYCYRQESCFAAFPPTREGSSPRRFIE